MWAIRRFAKVLTIVLVLFEVSLIYSRALLGDYEMAFLMHWIWLILLVYLNFQLLETTLRSSTNQLGFFEDNGLALLAVIAAIILFSLYFADVNLLKRWRREEVEVLSACFLYGLTDFVWGIMIAQRIAFAGKEREEWERRSH